MTTKIYYEGLQYNLGIEHREYGIYGGSFERGFGGDLHYIVLDEMVIKTTNLWGCGKHQGDNNVVDLIHYSKWDENSKYGELPVVVLVEKYGLLDTVKLEEWRNNVDDLSKTFYSKCKEKINSGDNLTPYEKIFATNYAKIKLGIKLCHCAEEVSYCTVSKRNANFGRKFWACAKKNCKFFEWEHDNSDHKYRPY